jgi:hypothetical protein
VYSIPISPSSDYSTAVEESTCPEQEEDPSFCGFLAHYSFDQQQDTS